MTAHARKIKHPGSICFSAKKNQAMRRTRARNARRERSKNINN